MTITQEWLDGKRLDREFGERFGPRFIAKRLFRTESRPIRDEQLRLWPGTPHLFPRFQASYNMT